MHSSLLKCQLISNMSDFEIKQHEVELYKKTGKALLHPNDFPEIYVREAVKKHIEKMFKK